MRPATALVICSLAAIAIGSIAAGAGEPPTARAAAAPELAKCPKHVRPRTLRCGSLELPVERSDPALGSTPIRFAVRPPTDRDRPPKATIFAVEGGPGYGSIGSARYYIHLFGPLLERRQLVLVDMRGTGHSRPIDCPALQAGRGTDRRGLAQCARILGSNYGAYRTSAAADDLDSVRAALGIDRIDLYGDSYGTYLAQSYAFRHGETLEALVLDSAYPLRGESGWYSSLWRTGIRSLSIVCRRSARCSGDAGRRLKRMVELLRATPRGVGPLLDAIASGGYSPPRSYLRIDEAIGAYLRGDPRAYRRLTATGSGGYGNYRYYSRGDELAVSCNDYPMLWDKAAPVPERRRQLQAQIRDYPRGRFAPFTPREIALSSSAGYRECLSWPAPSALYEPPAPPGTTAPAAPTLVISGELDDVTSPKEGRKVAADFPDSRFMLVPNAGHVPSLYGGRYPAAERVRAFLRRHG